MEAIIGQLRYHDILFIAVVISVSILFAFFASRRTWVLAEIFLAVLFGGGFIFFPNYILAFQMNEKPTENEILLARVYGGVYLGSIFSWFYTRETRDATVPITLMTSRVITSSILVMSQLVSYIASPLKKVKDSVSASSDDVNKTGTAVALRTISVWSEETFLTYLVLPTALWVIISLIHLLRSHDFHFYPQHNVRLNNHLRIDAWLMMLFGTASLAFPSVIVKTVVSLVDTPSPVSLHVLRSIGAFAVGEAVTTLQGPGFLHPRDKQTLFLTRIIMILLKGLVLAVGLWFTVIRYESFLIIAGLHVPLFVNAFLGLVTDSTKIYTVSSKQSGANKSD